jgi:phosphoglycolate phosphatase
VGDLRRLIVFDLDGTLVDSRRDLADAANALILERGGTPLPEQRIGGMVGDGAAVLVRRACAAAGLSGDESSLPRFLELYDERLLRSTSAYPGIRGALQALEGRGILAVLTNKPERHARKLLAGLDLDSFFSAVIGGDGPCARKPSPEGLVRLMAQHDVPPVRTALVGDSQIDAATALAAGTAFCLAQYGFGAEGFPRDALRGADAVVHRAAELPDALIRLLTAPPSVRP